ncbi:MAG: hypothetical protein ACI8QC_003884 [Planctomycetota bacterium]|jgi:hypothetical protein
MVLSNGRKRLALSGLLLLLAGQSHAQADSADTELKLGNGSFEQVTDGIPDGWAFPGHVQQAGYTLTLDSNEPAEGAQAELIHEPAEVEASEHLLVNRGFRWINEYPFNR